MKALIHFVLIITLLTSPSFSLAFETDQFNLPAEPLNDIGNEVTNYTKENLEKAIEKINTEILFSQRCLEEKTKKCQSPEKERKKLAFLRSEDAVAVELYNLIGKGVPVTSSSDWLEKHDFKIQSVRYKPSLKNSIYLVFPTDYIGLSSTINMYGAEFGTDKIAHLFQQGYDYLKIYKRETAKGLTHQQAVKKAVKWGQRTERTYYGTLVSGVYSNADLASNYAGLKFYFGLTRQTQTPPILILENGFWKFNPNADVNEHLLKPYISESFSEAFNPSIYARAIGLNAYARKVLKRNCDKWKKLYPNLSQDDFEERFQQTKLWFGEYYGFKESKNFITIANTCFDDVKNREN